MNFGNFRERAGSGVDPKTEDLATLVIGAGIEVHRWLKPGLPESVYRNALSHELELRGIPHVCEAPVPVHYKGKLVGEGRIDILVGGCLIVELKVAEELTDVHEAQVLAYLFATGHQLGLLMNFNVMILKNGLKRVINTRST